MTCSTKTMSWIMIPVILGFFLGSILVRVQLDVSTDLRTINVGGATGRALVVYHPGLSDFQEDVTLAYVEGLVEAGWACDLTTASRQTPMNLENYNLLVLGAPTYEWRPASPIKRYIERIEDPARVPVALILTGGGSTAKAASLFVEYVESEGGQVVEMLEIWQGAPNEERHGISDPLEIARQAGATLELP